ncbi:amidohydrolase family protein [Niabella drilacis]|uniref:Imidazolonepropionase n=1 Tax=Niabella drilacis (strain DSM 25811 / CCM 8410 / CCUG 62505 / LMG 26954 / E90) TaxID=1285928 RepID=A0A1G6I1C9_NIADE|nr:amidohydrolase family protein [Niabella drilacis]SDC00261.1 Imidazolonepropionase [Niabella drilacis]
MKKLLLLLGLLPGLIAVAQTTFPVNGVADPRSGSFALTNATIVKDPSTTIQNATLVIREGKIVSVGSGNIPPDAVVIDCKGKYIYPSLIDIYSDYGIAQRTVDLAFDYGRPQQFNSATKGAYNWNQAIKSEVNAADLFSTDDAKAQPLREMGFGTVLVHEKDGIARGTGLVATLSAKKENLAIIKERAAAFYSFKKGSSKQSYPTSMMGAVALLRQNYLDAQWYKTRPPKEGVNKTLEAWNALQSLPQIFETTDKWSGLRADGIGDEFGVQYIIKGGGDEYQRIREVAATKAPYIVSLNFPDAQKVEDPADARFIAWSDLAHWELAPTNPAAFEKAKIPFALTAADLKDTKAFWPNLRKAIQNGLSERAALEALTKTPASLLNIADKVGSLEPGYLANFLVTTGNLFAEKTSILENWIQGERYDINAKNSTELKGQYALAITEGNTVTQYQLEVKSNTLATVKTKEALTTKFSVDGSLVSISFSLKPTTKVIGTGQKDSVFENRQAGELVRLSGVNYGSSWQGVGANERGAPVSWVATLTTAAAVTKDSSRQTFVKPEAQMVYPFSIYGTAGLPQQETILIKNATVWTNEAGGRQEQTDVLVKAGKIAQVGKSLSAAGARVIDGTGKHLTPGIIDEHSHIATFSINEGAQSVTSEVRIGDNLNPDDINIYRQLSGGVTTSQILHGSANTIGGQSQLIKLRWGADAEGLKFKGADPFIKFALGENVKRTASTLGNNRYPDTRMGVYEVLNDAFQRAREYEKAKRSGDKTVRRDLELDALVEILDRKRFITCHSYVQSEILGLINVAEKYGFKVNTFTHILEGYKVADRIKQHGANVSTFSDWWAYKNEVKDAIPYNAALMHQLGLNVCINSDDAEMARRLNQEAAKTIRYGGVSEEDAFKMVTLNPAKALHIDNRVGSIKAGKDADLVLWSDNPLSIYARALYTLVDGAVYFDRQKDSGNQEHRAAERNRLIQKMLSAAKGGAPVVPAKPTAQVVLHCEDHEQADGVLAADAFEF